MHSRKVKSGFQKQKAQKMLTSKCEVNSNEKICSNYECMKIIYVNCGVKNYLKEDIAVIRATFAVVKRKREKIQACTGFEPLTSAIQANWEQVVELVRYKPVKG